MRFDLRQRVVAAIAAGGSCRQAAARFGAGASRAIRWWQLKRTTGSIGPKALGGDRRSARSEAEAPLILGLVQSTPDRTLMDLRAALAARSHGFGLATLWRFFARRQGRQRRAARGLDNDTLIGGSGTDMASDLTATGRSRPA